MLKISFLKQADCSVTTGFQARNIIETINKTIRSINIFISHFTCFDPTLIFTNRILTEVIWGAIVIWTSFWATAGDVDALHSKCHLQSQSQLYYGALQNPNWSPSASLVS